MKRLVQIANLPEVTVCFQQQKAYKIQVKDLSDHNKSLDIYKTLIKEIRTKTSKYSQDIKAVLVFKKSKGKKKSVVDYYTIILENLMEHLVEEAMKIIEVLEVGYVEAKEFHRKVDKMVIDSKKMMDEQVTYHEKLFKDYMLNVYPQTSSIFFRLQGTDKKFTKKEDSVREAALIQQYKAYEQVLNSEIDKVSENIRKMTETFKQKTEDIKGTYVTWFQKCLQQFEGDIREQELQSFALKIEPKDRGDRERQRSRSRPRDNHDQ